MADRVSRDGDAIRLRGASGTSPARRRGKAGHKDGLRKTGSGGEKAGSG